MIKKLFTLFKLGRMVAKSDIIKIVSKLLIDLIFIFKVLLNKSNNLSNTLSNILSSFTPGISIFPVLNIFICISLNLFLIKIL